MSAEGIEPSTNGLKGRCSAIELRARVSSEGHSNTVESERQQIFTAKACIELVEMALRTQRFNWFS